MRAILIDPFTRTVSDIDTDAGLDDLYRILDVELITVLRVGAGHAMILDDEGLMKNKIEQGYFQLEGMDQPLAGRGLILADEYGENRPATLTLEQVEERVVWLDNEDVDPEAWLCWTITAFYVSRPRSMVAVANPSTEN